MAMPHCPYAFKCLYSSRCILTFHVVKLWIMLSVFTFGATVYSQNTAIKILDMVHTNETNFLNSTIAYKEGLKASLWSRNFTVAGDVRLEIISTDSAKYMYDTQTAIVDAEMKNQDLMAVLGPVGDVELLNALPALKKLGLVALAPLSGSSLVRHWEEHFYFLNSGTMAEVYTLVRFAVSTLRVRRLGLMYLKDLRHGRQEYEAAVNILSQMGYDICGTFSLTGKGDWKEIQYEFKNTWEDFASTMPQAVIILGIPTETTSAFVKQVLKDERTRKTYILAPHDLQDAIVYSWKSAVNEGAQFMDGQLILTGRNPLPTDTRYDAINRFRAVMKSYLARGEENIYKDTEYFLKDDSAGEMMVSGWLVGEILHQIFASREWFKSRKAFKDSLFNQRRYRVDDVVVGDFGGMCAERLASQGAACLCNQGGRTVSVKRLYKNFSMRVEPEGEFAYPLYTCYATSHQIYTPTNVITLMALDNPITLYAIMEISVGGNAALPHTNLQKHVSRVRLLRSRLEDAGDALSKEMKNYITDLAMGIVTDSMIKVPNISFIDPIFIHPRLTPRMKNVIYLSPTIEQQIYVLARYLGKIRVNGAKIYAIIRSPNGKKISDVIRKSLVTFGLSLSSYRALGESESFNGTLLEDGDMFLLGINKDDLPFIEDYMSNNKNAHIYVTFSEFSLLFPFFISRFSKEHLAKRIVFATNMPHWREKNSTSPSVKVFQTLVPDIKNWTPLAFWSFCSSRAVKSVTDTMNKVNGTLLTDAVYSRVVLSSDDFVYGPFVDSKETDCLTGRNMNTPSCFANYGATSISVWSIQRVLNPEIEELHPPFTPSMIYTELASEKGKDRENIIIITSIVTVISLVCLICVFLILNKTFNKRNNKNAPRDMEQPVTLVFTDIESSTELWASCSDIMPDALSAHHNLIRKLIAKYKCYEVKTVGDSFMVACKSPFSAVQLVGEIQREFLNFNWKTSLIDEAYREFEQRRANDNNEYTPPSALLDDSVYRISWNGLRVRVGVHTGLSDIRYDEVTKGYDYYGATSNTAARTESVANGGQILLTESTYLSLSREERSEINVSKLGLVTLRGVPDPVVMYQMNSVSGRQFAELRLDREVMEETVYETESSIYSFPDVLDCSVDVLTKAIEVLFMAFPLSKRTKMLETLCRQWHVITPQRPYSQSGSGYCYKMANLLSAEVCAMFEKFKGTKNCSITNNSREEICESSFPSSIIIIPLSERISYNTEFFE